MAAAFSSKPIRCVLFLFVLCKHHAALRFHPGSLSAVEKVKKNVLKLQVRRTLRARAVMSNDGLAGAAAGLRGGGSVRSVRVALVSSNSLLVAESATPDNNLSELISTLPNPFSAPEPYRRSFSYIRCSEPHVFNVDIVFTPHISHECRYCTTTTGSDRHA